MAGVDLVGDEADVGDSLRFSVSLASGLTLLSGACWNEAEGVMRTLVRWRETVGLNWFDRY